MSKRYLALARVSSREQEREGFSLEVQEEALLRFAQQNDGRIDKFFRIAETATKPDERRTFQELLRYAKKHADRLDGLLFFKVDRAARNLFDYVELERLELDFNVPVIYVSQPTENTPAGRMMRRTLANMASFFTEQQSLDVKDGLSRRVQEGLFVGKAPYGYVNVRRDGRSLVEVDEEHGPKIPRIFELYAFHGHTLDSLVDHLADAGIRYTASAFRFGRSKLHKILRDRSYIGDIPYHGQWYPGVQKPLVDRSTFDRVQVLLGDQIYQSHDLVYACERITCGVCGNAVTGEVKIKPTKSGPRPYIYYRCAKYTRKGHPRTRVREADLDKQVLDLFDRMRIKDADVRAWFASVLRAKTTDRAQASTEQRAELQRQLSAMHNQRDKLLNLRLTDEIDETVFARKNTELRDREAQLTRQLDSCHSEAEQNTRLAEQAFELSQTLTDKWLTADVAKKRRLLEITCLNFSLNGATLVPTIRKPFDILVEGQFVSSSRGDWI